MNENPFSDWVRERPPEIQRLMIDWPPDARVRAKEGVKLMAPAPGVEGRVASWFEDGTIGVEAPMAETVTSPITGATLESEEIVKGICDPSQLEIVGYSFYGETEITPDLIRGIVEDE